MRRARPSPTGATFDAPALLLVEAGFATLLPAFAGSLIPSTCSVPRRRIPRSAHVGDEHAAAALPPSLRLLLQVDSCLLSSVHGRCYFGHLTLLPQEDGVAAFRGLCCCHGWAALLQTAAIVDTNFPARSLLMYFVLYILLHVNFFFYNGSMVLLC
jgi:hypothetical protein